MPGRQPGFLSLAAKTAVCHTLTYTLVGLLTFYLLHHTAFMSGPGSRLEPARRLWVLLVFQPLRGVLFSTVFYPLRSVLFGQRFGWLVMGWMLVAFGILGTFAPASGSLEGLIFSTTSPLAQLRGWLEIVPQAVLLSILLCVWVDHPAWKGLTWLFWGLFAACMALPVLGALTGRHM